MEIKAARVNQEILAIAVLQKDRREIKDCLVQRESQGRMVILDDMELGEGLDTEVRQDIQEHQEYWVKREIGVYLDHLEIYMAL